MLNALCTLHGRISCTKWVSSPVLQSKHSAMFLSCKEFRVELPHTFHTVHTCVSHTVVLCKVQPVVPPLHVSVLVQVNDNFRKDMSSEELELFIKLKEVVVGQVSLACESGAEHML